MKDNNNSYLWVHGNLVVGIVQSCSNMSSWGMLTKSLQIVCRAQLPCLLWGFYLALSLSGRDRQCQRRSLARLLWVNNLFCHRTKCCRWNTDSLLRQQKLWMVDGNGPACLPASNIRLILLAVRTKRDLLGDDTAGRQQL